MTTINAKNLGDNLDKYLSDVVKCNRVVNVRTKDGNAVIVSAEEYNGLVETVHLMGDTQTLREIKESRKEPLDNGTLYNSYEKW